MTAGDFHTLLSEVNTHRRQSRTQVTSTTTNKPLEITDIYIYPTVAKYTFLSGSHGTFTKTDSILGHEPHLTILENRKHMISTVG